MLISVISGLLRQPQRRENQKKSDNDKKNVHLSRKINTVSNQELFQIFYGKVFRPQS